MLSGFEPPYDSRGHRVDRVSSIRWRSPGAGRGVWNSEDIAMELVTRKCAAPGAPAGLTARFEELERRALMSASGLSDLGPSHGDGRGVGGAEFVYVESNNPQSGENAVIAVRRNPSSGALRQVGSFATGGTGLGNATQGLGPDDS